MILIEAGRIKSVGAGLAVPAGAEVVDLSQLTVLPGFIDAHTHLAGYEITRPDWEDAYARGPSERLSR